MELHIRDVSKTYSNGVQGKKHLISVRDWVASIHRVSERPDSRRPLYRFAGPYALGPGLEAPFCTLLGPVWHTLCSSVG